jgi:hypothetical protein
MDKDELYVFMWNNTTTQFYQPRILSSLGSFDMLHGFSTDIFYTMMVYPAINADGNKAFNKQSANSLRL